MDKSVTPEDFKTRLCLLITSKKISTREFELRSGLASGTIGKIGKQGLTASAIKKITDTFPDVSADWLISGKEAHKTDAKVPGIPLLPFGALAGYLGGNNGLQSFTGETVYFPDFSGADYAIRVEGDSMLPRYNNGDVLAIRVLNEPTFFQWGRVYVVSTTQGCIVKRLFPDPSDPDGIICHSENSALYPDYKITKSDVLAIAIVVGHAGVE